MAANDTQPAAQLDSIRRLLEAITAHAEMNDELYRHSGQDEEDKAQFLGELSALDGELNKMVRAMGIVTWDER